VHHADLLAIISGFHFGGKGDRCSFDERKRVHVCAQPDDWAGVVAVEDADHAGFSNAFVYLDAKGAKVVGDDLRSPEFTVTELGMLVEVAARFRDSNMKMESRLFFLMLVNIH
jgi:hypothetical protein